ncbi:MAG TPA: hypothetical protein VHU80_06810 [Polyangiaceae bacterium]|nr:hypothetical protein [Polyangiaceae bacterium]
MARKTPLQITIIGLDKKPFAVDKVTFTAGGKALIGKGSSAAFDLEQAGDATLQLEKKGHHSFDFALKIVEAKQSLTAKIDTKTMLDSPQMVTLVRVAPKKGSPGTNAMTITVGPPREIVLVTGFDYPTDHSGGMAFHKLAAQRMHVLRAEKRIDASTVVTWFDSKSGLRTRWVMGRSSENLAEPPTMWRSGWCLLSSDGVPPTTLDPKTDGYPGVNVNGIAEVYRHIGTIGASRPNTLEELGFLAHSWWGGPIFFDTFEHDEFRPGGARERERDPADKDSRFWKDFNSVNMPFKDDFKRAFSANPLIRVWGCLAVTIYLNDIRAALGAKNDKVKLGIPEENRTSKLDRSVIFPDTRPGIIQYIRQSMIPATYMNSLARVTGHRVEGGAPGMGALFGGFDQFGFKLFIARQPVKTKRHGKDVTIPGFDREMTFLEKNAGAVFTADGYMRYEP